MTKLLNKILITFGLVLLMGTALNVVNAQIAIPLPSSTGIPDSVVIDTLPPSLILNLREYGILPLLAYGVSFIIAFLVLFAVYIIIDAARKQIQADDNEDEIKEGWTKVLGVWKAGGVIFVVLIIYVLFSTFLGAGNVFRWPQKLAQCGGSGEPLFRAEYRASLVNPDLFKTQVLTYCCENFEFRNFEEIEEDLGAFEWLTNYETNDNNDDIGGLGSNGTGQWNRGDGIKVGLDEDGGWLFIADAGGVRPNVVPEQLGGVNSCEYFEM